MFTMGITGEATDQDMLTPALHPHPSQTSGKVGLNLALGLVTSCMMETCMLLAGVRLHEHW